MKLKDFLHFFSTSVLAFSLGFGSVACVATGLDLPVNMFLLTLLCAAGALVVGACLSLRRETLVLTGLYLITCLVAAFSNSFRQQVQALCCTAATHINQYYGLPIPQWAVGQTAPDQLLPLLMVAGFVMIVVLLTVTYQKSGFWAILASFLPLLSCIFTPDTMPDLFPLIILIIGNILFGLTQLVRHDDAHQGNQLTAFLLVPVGAAVIGLVLLIPPGSYHESFVYSSVDTLLSFVDQQASLQHPSNPSSPPATPPPHNDLDLSQLGSRPEIDTSVMKITTNYNGTMFIRGQDYDIYTGLGWQSSKDRIEDDLGLDPIWRSASEFVTIQVPQQQNLFYYPCYSTQDLTLTGGILQNPKETTKYTFSFSPIRNDWKTIWYKYNAEELIPPEVSSVDKRYLALPEETMLRAQDMLSRLPLNPTTNAVDAADIICKYVSQCAVYNTIPSIMPEFESDFSMWFLESGDAGYCIHFASAAVVLLRAAGIPARYVEGYLVQTNHTEPTNVQEQMSHAWVEFHLDYVGWVIMDPTPSRISSPPENLSPTIPPTITTEPEETIPSTPDSSVPSPTETTIPADPAITTPSDTIPNYTVDKTTVPTETFPPAEGVSPPQTPFANRMIRLSRIIIWGVILVLLVVAQWILRRQLVLLWLRRGSANVQALKRYRYIKYITRMSKTDIPEGLILLTEKAVFSQHTLHISELQPFDMFIQEHTKTMRQKPLYYRLILRFVFAVY